MVISGKKSHKKYRKVAVEDSVGKTIEAVSSSHTEGQYGTQPMITLLFKDGTKTSFVLPNEGE